MNAKGSFNKLGSFAQRGSHALRIATLALRVGHRVYVRRDPPAMTGQWLRGELSDLGATFIKVGQFLSTRADLFGEEFASELESLQDNVAPLPADDVRAVAAAEIDMNAFEEVDWTPLASASLAQVHRARLRDGRCVVMKVQRPGVREQLQRDLAAIQQCVSIAAAMVGDRRAHDLLAVLDQFGVAVQLELDYREEVHNMRRFRRCARDRFPWLHVPKVHGPLCSPHVITMEYLPSVRLHQAAAHVDRKRLATRLMRLLVTLAVEHGIVYVDSHPGNIGILGTDEVVLYDHGLVVDLGDRLRSALRDVLLAVHRRDAAQVYDLLLDCGVIVSHGGSSAYLGKRFVRCVLTYLDRADACEVAEALQRDGALMQMFHSMGDPPFSFSPQMMLVVRACMLTEGLCKRLDGSFSYGPVIDDAVTGLLKQDFPDLRGLQGYLQRTAMHDLSRIALATGQTSDTHDALSHMLTRIDAVQACVDAQRRLVLVLAAAAAWLGMSWHG